jgi:sulfate adenylyltransferase
MTPTHWPTLETREVTAHVFDEKVEGAFRVTVGRRTLDDLELFAVGALTPLVGFATREAYESILESMQLPDGSLWPLPITLPCSVSVNEGVSLALCDAQGRAWAVIDVHSIFERDPLREALRVFGTVDRRHPGVAETLDAPRTLVGGPVWVAPLPERPLMPYRLSPRMVRQHIHERGWKTVAGFQTRNPMHRAHEALTKTALELCDGLVLHPLVGETKDDDVPATVRFGAYQALLDRYYPATRTVLAAFPASMRYAGPKEALFHLLVRKNYGITHFIIGRDHAGVGGFYAPEAAQALVQRFSPQQLGATPLFFAPTFYCRVCEGVASEKTCPHGAHERLSLSGSQLRELVSTGRPIPHQVTRREVAEVLSRHAGGPVKPQKGVILWFTGLSGSGKSTLARAVERELSAHHKVEVLDGDEVRKTLSKDLGFSKADRDTNVRRIGLLARLLARNGVVAIAAAISPYQSTRAEVRAAAEADAVAFLEVHVDAPMETLMRRDDKGLYRRALAGELTHFTGVDDPYEAPERPELRLDTEALDVQRCTKMVLDLLARSGILP